MAFSESFSLGNSTFMNLENQANNVVPVDPRNSRPEPTHQAKPLDIIDESPTNSKSKPNKSRSRHHVSQFGAQRRKKFQKSKSDSTLDDARSSNHVSQRVSKYASKDDNYSEFFKSEFSIDVAEQKPLPIEGMSQVEAALKEIDDHIQQNGGELVQLGFEDSKIFSEILSEIKKENSEDASSSEVMDAPIFSEDVRGLLNDTEQSFKVPSLRDDDWKESLKFSGFQENPTPNEDGGAAEDAVNIDDATFICPDDEGREFAEKTIHQIRDEVRMTLEDDLNGQSSVNLSAAEKSAGKLPQLPSSSRDVSVKERTSAPQEIKLDLDELRRISSWNLPPSVLKEYEKKGICTMFEWQVECLSNPKVLFEHKNLVYSAPTSAGKTLVSEILLIKTILERGKKVIIILPFISVVREKMLYLQDLLIPSGYRVEGFFGGYTPPGGFDSINVAICTIEKANSIINKLLENGKLDEIGTVVVDEIHLISDPGRGYILELLLAKVLYMSTKFALQIQIITMSATLANVELLMRWLNAELFITDYRPVALQEMIKIGTKIYDSNMQFLRQLDTAEFGAISDQDHVAQLCIETLVEGCSVVVFCPSKDWCENLSVQLAAAIHAIGRSGSDVGNKLRANIKRDAIDEVKRQLKDIPTGLDSVLEKTVTYACAFHHAGLTTEERDIIEASFKRGALKIIVATSTLSSGVNLPARRVIIRSPLFGGKQMSSLTYKQMIGRAGRTGKDTVGESILICTDSNARIGKELFGADLKPISSCLNMDNSTHLKRALLEVISSGVATTATDVENFVKCTLLNTEKELPGKETDGDSQNFISDALDFLVEYEFIRLQHDEDKDEDNYVATRLGMACLASSMPPTDGLILFSELQKSRRCFVLESELHAVYLVTPYSVCYQLQDLDWLMYLDLWEKLSPAMKKVGELVGVRESFLVRAMRGQQKLDYKLMQIHKRFYTALALQELVNETPVNKVAARYKCTRGMLQSLQQMASTFAGIVTAFCNSLNWSMLSIIVGQFKERLFFGVHRDLIDLMRLPDLNYKRARALFDSGIEGLIDLANADVFTVEKILHNSLSFDTAKRLDNEDEYEKNQRNQMRNLYITGKAGLTVKEAAKMLVDDARRFVQYEIGVGNINWSPNGAAGDNNLSCEERSGKRKSQGDSDGETPPKLRKLEDSDAASKPKMGQKEDSNSATPPKMRRKEDSDAASQPKLRRNEHSDPASPPKMGREEQRKVTNQGQQSNKSRATNQVTKKDFGDRETSCAQVADLRKLDAVMKPNEKHGCNAWRNRETESGAHFVHVNQETEPAELPVSAASKARVSRINEPSPTKRSANSDNAIARWQPVKNGPQEKPIPVKVATLKDLNVEGSLLRSKQGHVEKKSNNDLSAEKNTRLEGSPCTISRANRRSISIDTGSENTINGRRNPVEVVVEKEMEQRKEQFPKMSEKEMPKASEPVRVTKSNPEMTDGFSKRDNQNHRHVSSKDQAGRRINGNQRIERNSSDDGAAKTRKVDEKRNAEEVTEKRSEPGIKATNERVARGLQKNNPKNSTAIRTECDHQAVVGNKENLMNGQPTKESLHMKTKGEAKSSLKPTSSSKNHLPSSTRINASSTFAKPSSLLNDDDLFMDDTSFEMNSAIADAMKEPRKDDAPANQSMPDRKSLNKSSDEIPASQEMTFQPKTQSTRYLRSYRERTQSSAKPSPKRTPFRNQVEQKSASPPPSAANPPQTNKTSSMEVSDISLGSSLIQNPIQLNASHILSTSKTEPDAVCLNCIQIVDICGSQMLFKTALKELTESKVLGFSVGVEKQAAKQKPLIGANLLINQISAKENEREAKVDFLVNDATYVSGVSMVMSENVAFFLNLQEENTGKGVTREAKINALQKLMENAEFTLQIFDAKEQLKVLRKAMPGIEAIRCKIEDPKVANWLLQPDKAMSFTDMAQQFAPECKALVKLSKSGRGYTSIGLDASSAIFGKIRSSIEACVTMHILTGQVENLQRIGTGQLHKFFLDLEMPLQLSLCDMEIYGFPANEAALRSLFQQMMDMMKKLEAKIYEAHGSRFNLGSASAVGRILGLHRKPNGRVSTSRQILEKIDSPIAQMIISYRKLSFTCVKNIQPLLHCIVGDRIHGQSITFTSTGRISMQEPNLQNVAKDFEIALSTSEKTNISCRSAFFPPAGRCLISADFCQLEMRILAHLSQDPPLLQVMKSGKDVFTAIAAKWNKISEEAVSEQLRNGTKQICYGIVYGMGMRSLAESLKCSEPEAMTVSEQFHATYPGIRLYAEKVMKFAKQHGYIETITGRRRYLDNINAGEVHLKGQAERQAVNSAIQGSAADIAKSAILRMEKNIGRYREKMGLTPRCVKLVMHLHDELIFEVPEEKAKKVAKVLSITMENCVRLSVPLKVKLRIGKSWGDLPEVKL